MMQVFGHRPSGNALFAMTGSFLNPGPYGGFIGITTAMSICFLVRHSALFSRITPRNVFFYLPLILAAITSATGLVVLPASMSRAGWLAWAIALTVFLIRETKVADFFKRRKWVAVISTLVIVSVIIGTFMLKKDSAIGRLHIWRMECRAIAVKPLGYGVGKRMGAYAEAQERFFRIKERSDSVVKVAGCPEYAFNEFLGIGMDAGILGLLAAIAVTVAAIVVLLRGNSVFAYGLIACTVFSLFSYPLSVPELALLFTIPFAVTGCYDKHRKLGIRISIFLASVLAILMIGSISERKDLRKVKKDWENIMIFKGAETASETAEALAPLEGKLSGNYRFLYDYGYSLFCAGCFRESIAILQKGTAISSDPMFRNIIGRDLEALGDYKGAEKEYLRSHYMVPCRLYPLVLLKEMYEKTGESEKAASILEKIRKMYINPKNLTMKRLAERAENDNTCKVESANSRISGYEER
jgi:tetratricopeptide (TPR) repeat protein